ncbi:MAG TPA: hypothetical protein G4O13_00080 [Dehalococcoidia bacterium]|nr:hypothetical protein [Dehalococcoidia bacterium]
MIRKPAFIFLFISLMTSLVVAGCGGDNGTQLLSTEKPSITGDAETVVLIVANYQRMRTLGYDDKSVDELSSAVQNLAINNPNGKGIVLDLGDLHDLEIDTAYDIWNGHEGDITKTNNLVSAIDSYIENLKSDDSKFPILKYVIMVGSHEVIPMKARPDDYTFQGLASESIWANSPWPDGLPLKSGYLYEIYSAGANGYYLTDTPYMDLSYLDTSPDHELSPELAVGRLIETPEQILNVINTYMNNNGEITKNQFVSIASFDYLDGGTRANDLMKITGVATDDSLIQCNYESASIPPLLKAKHDIVYFSGHGNYNQISTGSDYFAAGVSSSSGNTHEIDSIDGAVIITSGCHTGINFGNKLYHAPDELNNPTTYSEFPEDFAAMRVIAYVGATGYTAITHSRCETEQAQTGYGELLATKIVNNVVNGADIGTALRDAMQSYFRSVEPLNDWDRRVLAIPTLYGIPTYKDPPVEPEPVTSTIKNGFIVASSSDYDPEQKSERIEIMLTDYSLTPSGIVNIPGAVQFVSFNKPVLPQLFIEKTLPRFSEIQNISWVETESQNVVVRNNVPIAGIACQKASLTGEFVFEGFWPVEPYQAYSHLVFGGSGSEVGICIYPVQYNLETGEIRIWTKMVFDVEYEIPDTGIDIVGLCADKNEYQTDDKVTLHFEIANMGQSRQVDILLMIRDFDTSDGIAIHDVAQITLEEGSSAEKSYSVELSDIPSYKIAGRPIETELIITDCNNGDILASRSVDFQVQTLRAVTATPVVTPTPQVTITPETAVTPAPTKSSR